MTRAWTPSPDRCFDPNPERRALARTLYETVKDLPLVCPHGHVDPTLLANPEARFGSPAELFVIPDHYVTRMLVSQGVALEDLGVPRRDGGAVEQHHRRIWQRFADHFYLFRGTPTGLWITDELSSVFGITEKLTSQSAQRIYDRLSELLATPEYAPRALFRRFRIEVLCTTDAASDTLELHKQIQAEGFPVRPTFRPDAVVNLQTAGWLQQIERLAAVTKLEISNYTTFIQALEQQRQHFQALGATATDHAAITPYTGRLSDSEASAIFSRALHGEASEEDATLFTGHMLIEMARMSAEDGLVMQLHVGSLRNHHTLLFDRFGADRGADIPVQTEWTRNLRPLLNAFGNDTRFRLLLFTLDESSYSRELAPLAGYYPALRLGPPWWFFDSVNGMRRYLDAVIETAGFANTAGFNDDTRAFASIPARHDVWRRVTSDWLAGMVLQGLLDEEDASELVMDCAVGLARKAYRLG